MMESFIHAGVVRPSLLAPPLRRGPPYRCRHRVGSRRFAQPDEVSPILPPDFDAFLQIAARQVQRAVGDGDERKLRVDLLTPELKVSSRGYDPARLLHLIEGAILAPLAAQRQSMPNVLLYFDGVAGISAAKAELARHPTDFTHMASCRIEIVDGVAIEAGNEPEVAVFVQPEAVNVLNVRKTIKRLAQTSVQILVNSRLTLGTAGEPVELIPFRSGIYLEPFAVRKLERNEGPSGSQQTQQPLRLALFATYFSPWYLYLFSEDDQVYNLINKMPQRPTQGQLQTIIEAQINRSSLL